jgi:inhibitor of KinA sporulation pathway (predicted exonuclease)
MPWKIKKKLLRMDPKIESEWIMQMQMCWDGSDMNIFKLKLLKKQMKHIKYTIPYTHVAEMYPDMVITALIYNMNSATVMGSIQLHLLRGRKMKQC